MNFIKNLMPRLKEDLESPWFMLIIGLVTVFSWAMEFVYFPYIMLALFLILILIVKAKGTSIFNLYLLSYAGSHGGGFSAKSPLLYITIACYIPVVVLAVLTIIKNKADIFKKPKLDFVILGMLILAFSMLLSFCVTKHITTSIGYLAVFVLNIVMYVVLRLINDPERDRDLLATGFVIMALTVIVEMLIKTADTYVNYDNLFVERFGRESYESYPSFLKALIDKPLGLGWSMSNHYIVIINMGIPVAVYLFIQQKNNNIYKGLLVAFVILALICNGLSLCRGAWIGLVPMVIGIIIFYFSKCNHKKQDIPYLIAGFVILVIVAIFMYATGFITDIVDSLKNKSVDNGRVGVSDIAIEQFKKHPILGTGVGTARFYLKHLGNDLKNYHNYMLQVASTMGIVGVLAFIAYLASIIYRAFRIKDLFALAVLTIIAYFLIHGLVDTVFFSGRQFPIFNMLLAMIPLSKLENREKKIDSNDEKLSGDEIIDQGN